MVSSWSPDAGAPTTGVVGGTRKSINSQGVSPNSEMFITGWWTKLVVTDLERFEHPKLRKAGRLWICVFHVAFGRLTCKVLHLYVPSLLSRF